MRFSGEEHKAELRIFINKIKESPPDKVVKIYHGLNGGIGGALKVLNSQEKGVQQRSGPCFSVYPISQFWKPGHVGFEYSIRRGDIEMPGENKPDAKFKMEEQGIIYLRNESESLPLDQYDGRVLRTEGTEEVYEKDEDGYNKSILVNGEWKDLPPITLKVQLTGQEEEVEKQIQNKLKEFSKIRESLVLSAGIEPTITP